MKSKIKYLLMFCAGITAMLTAMLFAACSGKFETEAESEGYDTAIVIIGEYNMRYSLQSWRHTNDGFLLVLVDGSKMLTPDNCTFLVKTDSYESDVYKYMRIDNKFTTEKTETVLVP